MRNVRATLLRLTALLALLVSIGHSAHAATTIYGIRGTATAGANDIIRLDPTTGAFTVVYDTYPGGNAATIAQCPNGLIYYAINSGVNQLYVFNPQTPTVAPATLGAGLPDGGLKMACSPTGVLHYLTEAATNNLHIVSTVTGSYTSTVTITGEGAGGDIAFDSGGTLFGFNNAGNLFTIPLGGGAVTAVGTGAVTGLNGSGIGLAFTDANAIRVLTNGAPGFYSVNTGTNPPSATSLSTPPGGAATGDLASINVPNPDLSITKSASVSSVAPGIATPVAYTIVVTNSSAYAVSGTVTDTFPAGVSAVTWTCSASGGSTCVASGSGNINTIATLAAGGTATYTVNATVTAAAPVVNTASVALPFAFLTDATPANNSASNTILIRPTVSKAFGVTSFLPGGNTSMTITIGNANGVPITTSAVFTDALPGAPGPMTVNTAGNTGTCPNVTAASGSNSISMASGTVIPAGGCTIIVNVTATALGTYTNTIAAGALVTSVGSNAAAASANVNVYTPPTVTKAFGAASFASGGNISMTITIGNTNGVAITTSAVFTDTLPVAPGAMTVNTTGNTGTCANVTATAGSGNITMASGTSIPAGGCTIIVSVTAVTSGTYTNTIAAGALVTNAGSNAAATSANVNVLARPTVAKVFGAANFVPGGNTSLTITIGNANAAAITTTAVFTDTLPAAPGAMTVNTTGNTGTCVNVTATAGSGNITMSSGTSIPAGGCTIIVSITATATGTYTNTIAAGALVTNAGSSSSAASDSVDVVALPLITKSFSPASIASGGTSTLTITLSNPSSPAMTGATFDDYFPTSPGQMVVANPTSLINNCGGNIRRAGGGGGTLDPGDLGIRLNNGTIPANGSCTIIVNVTATVAGIYNNSIPVGELTVNGGGSNPVAANATLTVGMPSFTVAKSVVLVSDPVNGTTLPKAIPGAVVQYSILVTNSGAGTATNNTTVITDPIPANTRLFVGNLGGPGSGPIAFVDGAPSSGLTYTFTSLASTTDHVSFSNSGCATFNYTPTPDVDGFDAAVTCIRINPTGVFAAASGGNNPNFEARFRVRVN